MKAFKLFSKHRPVILKGEEYTTSIEDVKPPRRWRDNAVSSNGGAEAGEKLMLQFRWPSTKLLTDSIVKAKTISSQIEKSSLLKLGKEKRPGAELRNYFSEFQTDMALLRVRFQATEVRIDPGKEQIRKFNTASDAMTAEFLTIESEFRRKVIEPLTASLIDSKLSPPNYPNLLTETQTLRQRASEAIKTWKKSIAEHEESIGFRIYVGGSKPKSRYSTDEPRASDATYEDYKRTKSRGK